MNDFNHGGDIFGRDILYDFSANLNPLGMPKSVKNALINSVDIWEKYPDPFCRRLTKRLSEYEDFVPENIVCGNGAADLIYRIIRAVSPKNAVVSAPAFSEYEKALTEQSCAVHRHYLNEKNGFLLDEDILEMLDGNADILILCSPNNPTGRVIESDLLKRISDKCETENIIFLCDECFLDFVKDGVSARRFINGKIIILKAFTKIFSMAGIRLGYALFGSGTLAEKVRKTGQYWSVSAPAQIAGEAALSEVGYIEKTLEIIEKEREYLSCELAKFGFKIYPSDANFILLRADFPLDKLLLKEKILIRSCGNYYGLDDKYFRIAVRSHEENSALISAVGRVING